MCHKYNSYLVSCTYICILSPAQDHPHMASSQYSTGSCPLWTLTRPNICFNLWNGKSWGQLYIHWQPEKCHVGIGNLFFPLSIPPTNTPLSFVCHVSSVIWTPLSSNLCHPALRPALPCPCKVGGRVWVMSTQFTIIHSQLSVFHLHPAYVACAYTLPLLQGRRWSN